MVTRKLLHVIPKSFGSWRDRGLDCLASHNRQLPDVLTEELGEVRPDGAIRRGAPKSPRNVRILGWNAFELIILINTQLIFILFSFTVRSFITETQSIFLVRIYCFTEHNDTNFINNNSKLLNKQCLFVS